MTHNASPRNPNPPRENDSPRAAPQSPTDAAHEYSCEAPNQAAPDEATKQNDGFFINVATPADLGRIVEIDQASFSQPWAPRTFQDVLQDEKSIVLVARASNLDMSESSAEQQSGGAESVCAFGMATVVGEEAEIATLAVALEARGHGLGERLLRELMHASAMRDARRVFLEVRPSNASARRLYERLGFFECGRRRNYYADGEDALIMRADCNAEPKEPK